MVVTVTTLMQNYETYMKLNLSDYVNQWIAIFENKVITHGRDPKKVFDDAEKITHGKRFLLTRVASASEEFTMQFNV